MILRHSSWRDVAALVVVAALAALSLLLWVGRLPVQMWDEARLAMNAVEMMRGGSLLVPMFHGQADLWNPKPPLATWAASGSMRLFGMNELALRLPSIIAAMVTVFAVYIFTRRISPRRSTGVLAAMILLGSGGYVEVHVARTADADSLLVLFVTLASFALFSALQNMDAGRPGKWFLLSAIAFSCAVLTKGVAAFLILPGYVLALVALGDFRRIVKLPAAWLSSAIPVVVALVYCVAAARTQPGYLGAVWASDVVGRWSAVSDGHGGPWHFYAVGLIWPWQGSVLKGLTDILYTASAFPWSLALLVLAPTALLPRQTSERRAAIFCIATLVGFLVAISAAATKMPWYVAPAYPLIAVIASIGIAALAQLLAESSRRFPMQCAQAVLPASFVVALVCIGFVVVKNRQEIASAALARDGRLASFVQRLPPELIGGRQVAVISDARWDVPTIVSGHVTGREPYDGPVEFYVDALRAQGRDVRIVRREPLQAGRQLIVGCGLNPDHAAVLLRRGACSVFSG